MRGEAVLFGCLIGFSRKFYWNRCWVNPDRRRAWRQTLSMTGTFRLYNLFFIFGIYSLPARKSWLFIQGQRVDVVQEVANLFGKQWRWALGDVQFDAFQNSSFLAGRELDSIIANSPR
jgi:hypothetical protein